MMRGRRSGWRVGALVVLVGTAWLPGCGESPTAADQSVSAPAAQDVPASAPEPEPSSTAGSASTSANANAASSEPETFAHPECSPNLTPSQCDEARASLERDGRELSGSAPAFDVVPGQADPVDLTRRECAQQQAELEALRRRQTPRLGEIVSAQEQAELPGRIGQVQAWLDRECR